MTIVKPSSNKKRSSKQVVNKKLMRSADCSDVFSDIHVMKKKESESENDASNDEENEGEEGESQAPKEELQDLFAAIQNRMKKKSIDEKRAMENELKKTISRTVDEMNQKIELAKSQIDGKLLNMKMELEKIQRDRENHLKTIKSDYENFQTVIQNSINKIDYGEKRIHELRDKFISEIISFNRDFNIPKEKIEELLNSAVKKGRNKLKFSSKYH